MGLHYIDKIVRLYSLRTLFLFKRHMGPTETSIVESFGLTEVVSVSRFPHSLYNNLLSHSFTHYSWLCITESGLKNAKLNVT